MKCYNTFFIFLYNNVCTQGAKMEAVACAEHSLMLSNMLREGAAYEFLGVGFPPIYIDPLHHIFRLCLLDYFVTLSPHNLINDPHEPVWIPSYPRTFSEFEEVYQQQGGAFTGISCLISKIEITSGGEHLGILC